MHYEQKALRFGIAINIFSSLIGLAFYIITNSQTLLLDTSISIILSISTIVSLVIAKKIHSKETDSYPLGKYAMENVFLIFRAILMLGIILFTIFNGINTIINFINGKIIDYLNITMENMIIYGSLMVGACFAITITYSYFNKKIKPSSEIIRIEIISSLYDGLVTLFAVSSLLIFKYLDFLNPIEPIGDSIIVIILSLLYLTVPIKELIKQIKILTDKRRSHELENKIKTIVEEFLPNYSVIDVYCSTSSNVSLIYISLFPKENLLIQCIEKDFDRIRDHLYSIYSESKIMLLLSKEKIYVM